MGLLRPSSMSDVVLVEHLQTFSEISKDNGEGVELRSEAVPVFKRCLGEQNGMAFSRVLKNVFRLYARAEASAFCLCVFHLFRDAVHSCMMSPSPYGPVRPSGFNRVSCCFPRVYLWSSGQTNIGSIDLAIFNLTTSGFVWLPLFFSDPLAQSHNPEKRTLNPVAYAKRPAIHLFATYGSSSKAEFFKRSEQLSAVSRHRSLSLRNFHMPVLSTGPVCLSSQWTNLFRRPSAHDRQDPPMTTDIAVRGHDYNGRIEDYEEYDENSSARLFERSRIKALAETFDSFVYKYCE
uniref:Uncharacterized protein n=1 Tax=Steinernema glaseri TaxID=37863 RepID=A0A1I7YVN6_9BILA